MTKTKKILITGGAGFIGSHIVDMFINCGYLVVVVDNLSTGSKKNLNKKAKFYLADICDSKKIEAIFRKEKPDILNHHAAQKNVRYSVDNPVYDAEINILGGLNLLEAARKNGVKKIIFASSGGAIYGDTKNIPTPEGEKEMPVSPYGIAKLAFEKYLYFYFWQYKIPYIALRYANVYGPRQDPKGEAGVVAIFCENLRNNKESVIYGDGKQTRDFVYVKDIAEANLKAVQSRFVGAINIGTGVETDINNLYKILVKISESKLLKTKHSPSKAGEQKRSCLSYSKAQRILKWKPRITLEQGLQEIFLSYQTAY